MNYRRSIAGAAAALAACVALAGCVSQGAGSPSNAEEDGKSLHVTYYGESPQNTLAAKIFREKHPDVELKTEVMSFQQLQQGAKLVLTGDSVPDVMEYNKGNSTTGQLAAQGLITDLSEPAKTHGWDAKFPASAKTVALYDERGLMGSGDWYGVPAGGEYILVYYNKDVFDQYKLKVPTTLAEFEAVMQTLVDNGIDPISTESAETATQHLFYQLALTKANNQWVRDYQFFENPVAWHGPAWQFAAETFDKWVKKGYIPKESAGMVAEDMIVNFISEEYPIMITGSWWFQRCTEEMKAEWGTFAFPEAQMNTGSSGNLMIVPRNAKNKELAYDWIDIMLSDEVQSEMLKNRGLPLFADSADAPDERTKVLYENFFDLVERDAVGLFPDWPVPGMFEELNTQLQSSINGASTPDALLDALGSFYDEGKKTALGDA